MIGYLSGKAMESSAGRMLVGVGSEDNGIVGYVIAVPARPEYELIRPGKAVALFIHTHVREEALDLYGFLSASEKDLFLTLLGVNGIGPKGAMGMLSGSDPRTLIDAIMGGDKETLTRIPGVGKKTAERMVLELADSLRKKLEAGLFGGGGVELGGSGKRSPGEFPAGASSRESNMVRDARAALVGLGFGDGEVIPLLNRLMGRMGQMTNEGAPTQAEDLVKAALKQLS